MTRSGTILGGSLLVAGTSIGGGVLALPVLTGMGGFVPSLVLYLLCWAFMAATGLLYLEVLQWMKNLKDPPLKGRDCLNPNMEGVSNPLQNSDLKNPGLKAGVSLHPIQGEPNIISMAEKTLGFPGKAAAWAVYLFFFYSLTVAYVVGCGNLLTTFLPIPDWAGSIAFVALFAPFVFGGARLVGKINACLMAGLGISYFAFVWTGIPFVRTDLLLHRDWGLSLYALPIIFAAFGYQGIIPTLNTYLQRDLRKTRLAILIGSFIPLISYAIWQWLILGIVPVYEPGGLMDALKHGDNAVIPLKLFTNNPNVYLFGQFFAFFALTTSFFGVTLGLKDFLADGLGIEKDTRGKIFLLALVFLPPTIVAILNPHLFLKALDMAGGFGSALLLGLLPVLMAWSGRYWLHFNKPRVLPGGRSVLLLLIAFVFFELSFEIYHLFFNGG